MDFACAHVSRLIRARTAKYVSYGEFEASDMFICTLQALRLYLRTLAPLILAEMVLNCSPHKKCRLTINCIFVFKMAFLLQLAQGVLALASLDTRDLTAIFVSIVFPDVFVSYIEHDNFFSQRFNNSDYDNAAQLRQLSVSKWRWQSICRERLL